MNNRRLEYNPLFESITDSARRYETISEQTTVDKTKYAVEYARRIIETCYSQYLYFLNSLPDETKKNEIIAELDKFLEDQAKQPMIDFKTFFDAMISNIENIITQISSIQSIRNLENFSKLQEIFKKVEQGKDELKDVTFVEYTKQYATEYTSPDVKKAVGTFVKFSSEALKQSQSLAKKA
jgi:hypothetical protein